MGGGADKEQLSLIPDLLSRKENIAKAIDEKTFVLLICGGYQMFGKYYVAADGAKSSVWDFMITRHGNRELRESLYRNISYRCAA